jgi:hypothetical protein
LGSQPVSGTAVRKAGPKSAIGNSAATVVGIFGIKSGLGSRRRSPLPTFCRPVLNADKAEHDWLFAIMLIYFQNKFRRDRYELVLTARSRTEPAQRFREGSCHDMPT